MTAFPDEDLWDETETVPTSKSKGDLVKELRLATDDLNDSVEKLAHLLPRYDLDHSEVVAAWHDYNAKHASMVAPVMYDRVPELSHTKLSHMHPVSSAFRNVSRNLLKWETVKLALDSAQGLALGEKGKTFSKSVVGAGKGVLDFAGGVSEGLGAPKVVGQALVAAGGVYGGKRIYDNLKEKNERRKAMIRQRRMARIAQGY